MIADVPPTLFDARAIPAGMQIDRWTAPDGWPLRTFAWDGDAPRGSILFQGGRGDHVEKALEPLAHWRGRGWNVAGFDWRGQGGSGRIVGDPLTGHLASLDPLVDELAAFMAHWQATAPGPHVLIGHSMGGHLVLRLLAERRPAVAGAVLVAPMLGLNTGPLPKRAAHWVAAAVSRAGFGERAAWSHGEKPGRLDRQRNLTADDARYADEMWWRSNHPELVLGAPSFGWLAAAFTSIAKMERPGVLEAVTLPVLILGAEQDRLVSADAIRAAATRMPGARLRMFGEARHEILREADAVRVPAMTEIDTFLDAL